LKVGPLYAGFAATGVGVALPGAIMPALIDRWHLGDGQAGLLLMMSFLGSSAGALLVRGSLRLRVVAGSGAIAVAALLLGFAGGSAPYGWMALYGLGLGMTMTAISLVRQQQAARAGVEMVRLNLLWAVGALICPSLMARALAAGAIGPTMVGLAGCFLLLAVWGFFQEDVRLLPALRSAERSQGSGGFAALFRRVPPGLIAMILLITGVEASAGGWLATYARRGGHSLADTIAAPSFLWAGLLLSRLFWSMTHRWIGEAAVVRGSVSLMAGGAVLLIAGGPGWTMLLAAFLLGVGIGPTYPLLLAWALHFERGGSIFFMAGLGSAVLPWLTGAVSASRGSLRMGLAVPVVGCLVMLGVAWTSPLWEAERA
jgi:FHS family glucose/mannose:H+ symporter-like MFS transporter